MGRHTDYLVYGIHAVRHAFEHAPQDILELWLANSRKNGGELEEILGLARNHGLRPQRITAGALDKLTGGQQHQGVAIRRRPPRALNEDALTALLQAETERPKLFLVLDGIQDPHNLGACLRTADAAGVAAVIAPKDKAAGLTGTVCKVASGAAETVAFITVTNLARSLRHLQEANVWLIGTDDAADKEIFDTNLSGDVAIVMGAEGKGLRQNTRKHCDELVRLPMLGSVASLNVSVATGVCLYEVLRQRRHG